MEAADSSPTFLRSLRFEHIFLVIFIVALVLRFLFLDLKLFHHDEAVHAWFSYVLLTEGKYVYDPVYHGPLLYYTTAGMFSLFGDSDLIGRIVPSLLGSLMVLFVWPIYRLGYLGRRSALIAALFIAISPDMVYFSRFLRNDIFVAFFTLLLLVALLYYFEYGQRRYVVVSALAAALGCCSKENMPIILLIFGVFLLAAIVLKQVHLKKGWWLDFILGIAIMLAVGSLFYSSFGAHPEVLWTGAFEAIEHWTAMSSQQRLGGPPYFYIILFLLYELPIGLLAVVGTVQAAACALFLWRRRTHPDTDESISGLEPVSDISQEAMGEDDAMLCRMPAIVETAGPVTDESAEQCAPGSESGSEAESDPETDSAFWYESEPESYSEPAESAESAELRAEANDAGDAEGAGEYPLSPDGASSLKQTGDRVSALFSHAGAVCSEADSPGIDRRLGFALFCIWWMGASLAVYAVIGEKVPWLILHQLLPMIFVASFLMTRKKAMVALAMSIFLIVMMAHVAFTPADINEPIVQVQNSEQLRELFRLIDAGNATAVTSESVWPLPWYYRGDRSDKLTYLSTAGDQPEYFEGKGFDVIVSHNPDGFDSVPGYLKKDVIRQSYWFSIYDNRDRLIEYYLFRDGKFGSINWNIFVLPETASAADITVNATA